MEPFVKLNGVVAPIDRVNIDTDQVIPAVYLKRIERTGYGQFLFSSWRFLPDGSPNPDFVLNQPGYQGAGVLVAGRNFGCGSSRGARTLGATGVRLPVHHRAQLRRYLLQQLLPEWTAAGSPAGRAGASDNGSGPGESRHEAERRSGGPAHLG